MKKYTIISAFLLTYSLALFSQEDSKNYILALSVDLYMNTSSRVTCDNFATVFERVLIVNTLSQRDSVALFYSFVKKARFAKRNREIDVRCKFVYDLDNELSPTVCTDGRNILVNGKLTKKNKRFIDFLNSIVHRYPSNKNYVSHSGTSLAK